MELTKQITIQGADKTSIVFEVDCVVTQWHNEKMSEVYRPYMEFYDKETFKLDITPEQRIDLANSRETTIMKTYVKSWNLKLPLTIENIKRSLLTAQYTELLNELYKINDGDLTEEKKTLSQEDLSTASTLNETVTE